jgi:ribonuclease BN (tRNA processing enzyme)
MEMRLTVIGCSPAWPNPGSAHSGYLVESPDCGRVLLDCGPGVLARLRSERMLDVDAVVITHFHLDHWGDLVPWAWLTASGRGPASKPALWLPPDGTEEIAYFAARWGQPGMFELAFEINEYRQARAFTAAGFDVNAIAVEHYGFPANGLRLADNAGAVLAYSGDSGPCPALEQLADGAGLFLCEATLASGSDDGEPRGHLSAEEALGYADGRLLLTHRPAELGTPPGCERAKDGLSVDVEPRPAAQRDG